MRGLAFVLSLPLALGSCSQPAEPPEISDVWTRDTVGGTVNAAVFMTIRSHADDRLVGASSPEIMFMVVVFPHPDGPSRATNDPWGTWSSRSLTATTPPGNSFVSASMRISATATA